MKIFSAAQIRAWDDYTIAHEPIASIDLMERAAQALAAWMAQHVAANKTLCIFCGTGNNGGDGLALDCASAAASEEAMMAGDITEQLGRAFKIGCISNFRSYKLRFGLRSAVALPKLSLQ